MRPIFLSLLAAAVLLPDAVYAKLNVVATLPDYAAIAQAVGGDRVTVTPIARGTEDQHFVDAKPSFVRVLNKADVLIEGGAEMEVGWLPPLVNQARNPKILGDSAGHLRAAREVPLLDVAVGPVDRSMGDVHPAGNPHFSLDPVNGGIIAGEIAAVLAKVDPANAGYYASNRVAFERRLEAKLAEWTRQMAPYRGTKVLTYHRSMDYFLKRFGLELAGTIEPKPGIEPSPTYLSALVPAAQAAGVRLVLIEPFRPRKTADSVAGAIPAKLVVLAGSVGANPQIRDYFELFDYNIGRLVDALKP